MLTFEARQRAAAAVEKLRKKLVLIEMKMSLCTLYKSLQYEQAQELE